MRLHEEPLNEAREIYKDPEIRKLAQNAARVEATGYCKWSRVEEIMEFARRLGVNKLGIASCGGLRQESRTLVKIFEMNGFEVASVLCKTGSISLQQEVMRMVRSIILPQISF